MILRVYFCLFVLFAPSFNSKEIRCSPKRRSDSHVSRTFSTESEQQGGEVENKKEAEENKENMGLDEYYSDQDSWNESVISGMYLTTSSGFTGFQSKNFSPK